MESKRLHDEVWFEVRSFETKWAGVYARAVTRKLIGRMLKKETDNTNARSIQWKITNC